jgi:beta-glucosidase
VQDPAAALVAAHHLLLAHGMAARVLRTRDRTVALTLNLLPYLPASAQEADELVARRLDGMTNRIFLDPVLRGRYPEDVLAIWERVGGLEAVRDGDEEVIAAPLDALGVNYYTHNVVASRPGASAGPSPWPGVEDAYVLPPEGMTTAMGWGIDADGLTDMLLRLHAEYPPIPLYITENGAAFPDPDARDGEVDDALRVAYLHDHLSAVQRAIAKGVDLRGYFVWSLLDNFEWELGYGPRFGIVHVDFRTQVRTPKRSARWYAEVIRRNGVPAPGP